MSTKDEQATFPDHFSGHATDYARFRPDYPDALFAWMASLAPDPAQAVGWDVGCGNGQATLRLAECMAPMRAPSRWRRRQRTRG